MVIPTDEKLYKKIKNEIYLKYPKHSAYRSGLLVKSYKQAFSKKYSNKKSPYIGNRPTTKTTGLKRWFAEDWRNQRGEVGYRSPSDVYRPTKKITSKTPVTFGELKKSQINRARLEKYHTGRVKRFAI
jgi:hypothetical protein